ncbi:hypothetical protein RF55_25397, partial [Lasius niger]
PNDKWPGFLHPILDQRLHALPNHQRGEKQHRQTDGRLQPKAQAPQKPTAEDRAGQNAPRRGHGFGHPVQRFQQPVIAAGLPVPAGYPDRQRHQQQQQRAARRAFCYLIHSRFPLRESGCSV